MPETEELTTTVTHFDGSLEDRREDCFIVGICGGSGSGKTTLAENIIERLNHKAVAVLSMDSYYRVLPEEDKALAREGRFNFDHPSAIDCDLLFYHFSRLKQGKSIDVPEYDFTTHSRTAKIHTICGAKVVIFEGIMVFSFAELLELMDLKIFVDADAELRLSRRLMRDICHRGRRVEDVICQYQNFVKPIYDDFIAPKKSIADIIIPCDKSNPVAINLIVSIVENRLKERLRQR